MTLLLPIISFIIGLIIADIYPALKITLAKLLSVLLIPIVIIYNMVFYQSGSLQLIVFSLVSSFIIYTLYRYFSRDQLSALCMSYPNLAWLGFPIALTIFGASMSAAMVALYIGGSLFGNVMAVVALHPHKPSWAFLIRRMIFSPPIVALFLAALARLCGVQHISSHFALDMIYQFAKIAMTFSGMVVLGMWLKSIRLSAQDFIFSTKIAVIRLILGLLICTATWYIAPFYGIEKYLPLMVMLFLLPPAANIVALETYYRGSGQSGVYIAAGTIISGFLLLIFYVIIHTLF